MRVRAGWLTALLMGWLWGAEVKSDAVSLSVTGHAIYGWPATLDGRLPNYLEATEFGMADGIGN